MRSISSSSKIENNNNNKVDMKSILNSVKNYNRNSNFEKFKFMLGEKLKIFLILGLEANIPNKI